KQDRAYNNNSGKSSARYQDKYGSEAKIQIGDKYTDISNIKFALTEARGNLLPELQDKVMVALKVDEKTNTGMVTDIKQELRDLNMLKIIYITTPGNEVGAQ